jgi:hypothetical protein
MAPQPSTQSASNEAQIILAIQALENDASLSVRQATELYNVKRIQLRRQRAGTAARRDCEANSKILTKLEEEVIVKFIIKLDTKGFSPTLAAIRDMANTLLAKRSTIVVG